MSSRPASTEESAWSCSRPSPRSTTRPGTSRARDCSRTTRRRRSPLLRSATRMPRSLSTARATPAPTRPSRPRPWPGSATPGSRSTRAGRRTGRRPASRSSDDAVRPLRTVQTSLSERLNSGVDRIDGDVETVDLDGLAGDSGLGTPAAPLAPANLDPAFVLRHEDVFLERVELLKKREALVAVSLFGRPGQHLHDDSRVGDRLAEALAVLVLRSTCQDRTAHDARFCVRRMLSLLDVEQRIGRVNTAL